MKLFRKFFKKRTKAEPLDLFEEIIYAKNGNKLYVGIEIMSDLASIFADMFVVFAVKSLTYIIPKDKLEENEKMYGPHPFRERFKRRGNNCYAEFNVEKDLIKQLPLHLVSYGPVTNLLITGARFCFDETEISLLDSKVHGNFLLIKSKNPQIWINFFEEKAKYGLNFRKIPVSEIKKYLK
jgi:hypothetical protein